VHKADLYKKGEKGLKGMPSASFCRCLACKHYCTIPEGETGICGVRMNNGGRLELLVYGHPAAVNVDPMEKKPMYHFLPGSSIFSIGTVGCNLSCKFCQNWDLSQATKILKRKIKEPAQRRKSLVQLCEGKLKYGIAELGEGLGSGTGAGLEPDLDFFEPGGLGGFGGQERLSPDEAVKMCKESGARAIAYTYNEPTIFFEYARDIGVKARAAGLKNVFVTSGYESSETLAACEGWMDGMNIDIKSFSEEFYRNICGVELKGVLETVRKVFEMGIWVEITTLVIPGMNDSDEELKGVAAFIAGLSIDMPWHVTAFHPAYKIMDRPETPPSTLERAWKIGRAAGLRYVYTGNIFGGHDDTECPSCGEVLVERMGMGCRENRVVVAEEDPPEAGGAAGGGGGTRAGLGNVNKGGACFKCGEKIAGVWK